MILGEIRDGSEKQIAWAEKIRKRFRLELANGRRLDEVEQWVLADFLREWKSAQFWIEIRNKPAIEVVEAHAAIRREVLESDPFEGLA